MKVQTDWPAANNASNAQLSELLQHLESLQVFHQSQVEKFSNVAGASDLYFIQFGMTLALDSVANHIRKSLGEQTPNNEQKPLLQAI